MEKINKEQIKIFAKAAFCNCLAVLAFLLLNCKYIAKIPFDIYLKITSDLPYIRNSDNGILFASLFVLSYLYFTAVVCGVFKKIAALYMPVAMIALFLLDALFLIVLIPTYFENGIISVITDWLFYVLPVLFLIYLLFCSIITKFKKKR